MKKNLLIGLIVLIIFTGFIIASKDSKNSSNPAINTETVQQKADYEILTRKENKTVENISVLISPGEDGEKVATEVKETCIKPCNINVYDDRRAFELQSEYDAMMSTLDTEITDLDQWKEQNYVYVADHLVGFMEFSEGYYNEYPYKDSFYKELKGE